MNFGLKCYFVWLKYDKNQARYEKSGEDWTKRTLIAKIYPFYKPFIVRNILYKRLCVDNFKYLIYDWQETDCLKRIISRQIHYNQ